MTDINSKFHAKHTLLAYGRVLEDTRLYMARVIKAKEKESKLCPNCVFYYLGTAAAVNKKLNNILEVKRNHR